MSTFDNPFVRFCTSGLGTGTTAGKAAGYTLLLCGIGVVAVWQVGKFSYKMVKKSRAKKQAIAGGNPADE